MIVKRFGGEVELDIIPFGTCFNWNGSTYIQCEQHKFKPTNFIFAVRLTDGKVTAFEKNTKVNPVKGAEVILK